MRRAIPLLATAVLAFSAVSARAGLFDGLLGGGGTTAKATPGQRLWVVREFSEIRLVAREAGSQPNQHPAQVSADVLRQHLGQVRFQAGNATQSLFTPDEAAELTESLVQALAAAGPGDDVLLVSSARRADAVMFRPVAVTARLFVQSGALQLIVNDARYEFYDKYRGTNQAPEFSYGSRTRTGKALLRDDAATVVRADWVSIPLASAPAAVAAPAAAAVPAAPAAPAPAATLAPPAAAAPVLRPRDPGFADEVEQRLTTLKRLRDRGLISEEEYQQKRKEILQLL